MSESYIMMDIFLQAFHGPAKIKDKQSYTCCGFVYSNFQLIFSVQDVLILMETWLSADVIYLKFICIQLMLENLLLHCSSLDIAVLFKVHVSLLKIMLE